MSSKLPSIVCIYDRYSKASQTRKAVVEIRISYQRKQKYISTGITLYPRQWKNGAVVNHPDAIQLNEVLNKLVSDIRRITYEDSLEGNIDIFSIPSKLRQKSIRESFIEYCEHRAEIRKYGKSIGSQKRYDRFIRFFKQWGGIIAFEDINEANVIAYDRYLDSSGMKTNSKWNNYHRFLNSFIIDAIDEGLLVKNPYKRLNIEKEKYTNSLNKCITLEEFNKIREAKMPWPSLERARDLFVFQTYTCLSFTDLMSFDSSRINEVNGMKVYINRRAKTRKTFTIPLLQPALDILYKYNNVLPKLSNAKYNEYLKSVAVNAKVDKPISTHWARHTGATLLLNEGIDIRIIAKICGHSSTRITEEIYAKLLDETVVDAIESIKDRI